MGGWSVAVVLRRGASSGRCGGRLGPALAGGGGCLEAGHPHAAQARTLLGRDGELPAVVGEAVADLGDASGQRAQVATERLVFAVGEGKTERLGELLDLEHRV